MRPTSPAAEPLDFHCESGYQGSVEDRPPVWHEGLAYHWP